MQSRPHYEILSDPQALPEETRVLSAQEQIMHPNCPSHRWWELAPYYPRQAVNSPLHPIALLEDPGRWQKIQERYIRSWIMNGTDELPKGPLGTIGPRTQFRLDVLRYGIDMFGFSQYSIGEYNDYFEYKTLFERSGLSGMTQRLIDIRWKEYHRMQAMGERKKQYPLVLFTELLLFPFFSFSDTSWIDRTCVVLEVLSCKRPEMTMLWMWERLLQYHEGTVVPLEGA